MIKVAAALFLLAASVYPDQVYPVGQAALCDYDLSATTLRPGDTLTIHRVVVGADGPLYLSERVPVSFRLVGWSINIPATLEAGSDALYWLVADPFDSLDFVARFAVPGPGLYLLPLHTTVWPGTFSTGPPIMITVEADLIPPATVYDLKGD